MKEEKAIKAKAIKWTVLVFVVIDFFINASDGQADLFAYLIMTVLAFTGWLMAFKWRSGGGKEND